MKKSYLFLGFLAVLFLFVLASCSNYENVDACLSGKNYGFLYGIIHGIMAPVDLIVMLFRDDVCVFAVNNNGAGYSLGFLIGSGGWGLFGGKKLGGKD